MYACAKFATEDLAHFAAVHEGLVPKYHCYILALFCKLIEICNELIHCFTVFYEVVLNLHFAVKYCHCQILFCFIHQVKQLKKVSALPLLVLY